MSRNDGRSTRLRARPSRTAPALITALLMLVAGGAVAWVSILRLLNGHWPMGWENLRDWLAEATWDNPWAWAIGGVLLAVGLILVLCSLIPGGFNALNLVLTDPDGAGSELGEVREMVMSRRAVAHLAKAQALDIDGVGGVTVTATAKHVHLSVRTPLHEIAGLAESATQRVRTHLEETGLSPVPRVSATVRSTS